MGCFGKTDPRSFGLPSNSHSFPLAWRYHPLSPLLLPLGLPERRPAHLIPPSLLRLPRSLPQRYRCSQEIHLR